jgi:hypothetical protein
VDAGDTAETTKEEAEIEEEEEGTTTPMMMETGKGTGPGEETGTMEKIIGGVATTTTEEVGTKAESTATSCRTPTIPTSMVSRRTTVKKVTEKVTTSLTDPRHEEAMNMAEVEEIEEIEAVMSEEDSRKGSTLARTTTTTAGPTLLDEASEGKAVRRDKTSAMKKHSAKSHLKTSASVTKTKSRTESHPLTTNTMVATKTTRIRTAVTVSLEKASAKIITRNTREMMATMIMGSMIKRRRMPIHRDLIIDLLALTVKRRKESRKIKIQMMTRRLTTEISTN